MNSGFAGERAVRTHSFDIALPATEAFSFFTPEGERSWAPGWDPRYVYPRGPDPEKGTVFTTGEGAEKTLWLISRYEPAVGEVEYVRITPGNRLAIVHVHCAALDSSSTRVTVSYEYTGLSDAGNDYVRSMDEAAYREFIESWGEAIRAAIAAS